MPSTSSKGTYAWHEKYDFLTEPQRREYGAVVRLTMPGNLAAQITWRDRPTKLEFVIEKARRVIRQDGDVIAHTAFSFDHAGGLAQPTLDWGAGVFGELNARILSHAYANTKLPSQ